MKRKTFFLVLLLACSSFLFTSCLNSDDSPQELRGFVVYKQGYMGTSEYFVNAVGEKLKPGISLLTQLNDGDLVYISFTAEQNTPDKDGFYQITLLNYTKLDAPVLRFVGLDTLGKDIVSLSHVYSCLDYLILDYEYTGTDAKKHSFYIASDSVQKENPNYFKNDTLFIELRHNAHDDSGYLRGRNLNYLDVTKTMYRVPLQTSDSITISVKYIEAKTSDKNQYQYKYIKWGKPKYE